MWGDDGASIYLSPVEVEPVSGWSGTGPIDFTMAFWFKVSVDYTTSTS
jgi:hypothetical protein